MARIKEQEIFVNPYVVQMDKFAESLQHLSKTFLNMEHYKGTLSKEEIDEMFDKVTGNVCAGCERKEVCLGERREKTYQMMYEIMCAAEEYGAELNMELKKRLKRQCMLAPRFLRESLEVFENAKQILMWNHRMLQTREGYATQLTSFAKMIQYTTRELDAGIFQDEYLEKRIKTALKKENVKMLSIVFYMTQQGKYEVHLTVKAVKGRVILAKDIAFLVGKCIGRTMIPIQGERLVIGKGFSKKEAQQHAAEETLKMLRKQPKFCDSIFQAKTERTKMEEEPVMAAPDIEKVIKEEQDFIITPAEEKERETEKEMEKTFEVDFSDIKEASRDDIIAAAEEAAFAEENSK